MIIKIKTIFIVIVSIVYLYGCAPSVHLDTIKIKAMPQSFNTIKDTSTNIASWHWKQYFKDTILKALIDSALASNLEFQQALQKVDMSKAILLQNKGLMSPSIAFAPNGTLRKFGLYTMDGAGNKTTFIKDSELVPEVLPDWNIALQSNWEIDLRGKLSSQVKAAQQRVHTAEAAVLYIKSNMVSSVASAYYQLLSLDFELDIIQQSAIKQKEALSFIQAQREVGKASELAVQQFTAQYLNLSILQNDIQNEIRKVENAINILLGRYPQALKRDKQGLLFNDYSFAIGVPAQLLENRPDIKMAAATLQATKWDLQAAKNAFYPSLMINANWGLQAFNSKYLFQTPSAIAYQVLGGMTAPLVNRAAIKSNFALAKAQQLDALYAYHQTILNAFVEVYNNYQEIVIIQEQKKLIQQKNSSLNKAAENALDLFRAGRVPYLDVLLAQQSALQSNLEVINIANRNFQSKIKLYKSVGGGWD